MMIKSSYNVGQCSYLWHGLRCIISVSLNRGTGWLRTRVWRSSHGERGARTYNGVLKAESPAGSRPLGSWTLSCIRTTYGVGHFVLKFLQYQNFRRAFGDHGPVAPRICQWMSVVSVWVHKMVGWFGFLIWSSVHTVVLGWRFLSK